MKVLAPLTGVVAEVLAPEGTRVAAGAAVLVVESMKMHHEVQAPTAGVVLELSVGVGDQVEDGQALFSLAALDGQADPGEPNGQADPAKPDAEPATGRPAPPVEGKPSSQRTGGGPFAPRADLAAVLERRRGILDEARPEAVARRRELGRRTARENVAELCDEGSFQEYGGLALAAQKARRTPRELLHKSPGDGIVTGIGTVNGESFGADRSRCVVMAYDYTVFAGTQGIRNHRKTDRVLVVAEKERLPVVLFAEGGGGRPGDTDSSELFHLVVPTFHSFAKLSGLVPRVGIVSGRCFAGNAALLGCCDLIVATPDASIGMGGPAMIEGGGLGVFSPEEVGPAEVQRSNGVIDVLADDEAQAVAAARQALSYFQGSLPSWTCADQTLLREIVPEGSKRVHDARALVQTLLD